MRSEIQHLAPARFDVTGGGQNPGGGAAPFLRRLLGPLLCVTIIVPGFAAFAGSTRPYYSRSKPSEQDPKLFALDRVDFTHAHLPAYLPHFETNLNALAPFNLLFDARAAAAIARAAGPPAGLRPRDLLEEKDYDGNVSKRFVFTARCLAAMAYLDYFPGTAEHLRDLVSEAVLEAKPGWAGTFGPGVNTIDAIIDATEGNYDMAQMHLLMLVYRYYDELTPAAREHLIAELLQKGTIHRPGHDDTFTSGAAPTDWPRAGTVKIQTPLGDVDLRPIGETENHILMILTTRYLCNQLLYQRTRQIVHDNRRNGSNGGPACTDLALSLLRNILRGDFSEYNAKNYQTETRWALLNLCTFAYDHEVRLAARMVLDYVSALRAVSSSDLRRMTPFRRRNEGKNVTQLPGGFMGVGLLDYQLGGDPLSRAFTLQTGHTRAYKSVNLEPDPDPKSTHPPVRPWEWALADDGKEPMLDVLSDYRLPPPIHALFVIDSHRRFFQRLHRTPQDEQGGNRNCDNMEIYAGSPSYLITAGGEPATWAIDASLALGVAVPGQDQQLGVAVTTSFMPAGESAGEGAQNMARDLIQFGRFSDDAGKVVNYGVAPDFACGHRMYRPSWVRGEVVGQFLFVKQGYSEPNRPGFYLAIYEQPNNGFSLMEAFDTWRNPRVTYDEFKLGVLARNPNMNLRNNVEAAYTTHNGNRIRFVIWNDDERDDDAEEGARVLGIDYGAGNAQDTLIEAGNDANPFLSGNIMTSPREAVVEIRNPSLGAAITLDMSDKWHPRRIDENGVIEQAGFNNEVWVDFEWTGPSEGDVYRPFKTLAAAAAAVADGGVIKILPGSTTETPVLGNKRITLAAPIGGVFIGVR